jgi:hypothetical protein
VYAALRTDCVVSWDVYPRTQTVKVNFCISFPYRTVMWLHFFLQGDLISLQQIIGLSRWRNIILLLYHQLQRFRLPEALTILQPSKQSLHRLKQMLEMLSVVMHTSQASHLHTTVHFQRLINLKFPSWISEEGISETLEDNPEAWHTFNLFCLDWIFSVSPLWLSGQSSWPGSIPDTTRFSEKYWVWNRVHSALWVKSRS